MKGGVTIYYILIILLVIIDQLSKRFCIKNYDYLFLKTRDSKIKIRIVKNSGAAYSILSGKTNFLIIITIFILIILIIYLNSIINYSSIILNKLSLSLIIGGGIGNLIDRIRLKYVIDFIYIDIKNFPIFNLADIFIIIGALMSIVIIILG